MQLDLRPGDDPVAAMRRWYALACAELPRDEAHRVALATSNREGEPSVRIVLCREIDAQGRLLFYTNYESEKGRVLAENPRAALVFHWGALGRQLRATGSVMPAPGEVSDAYWATRPRESQLSALSSPQSRAIEEPEQLAQWREALEREWEGRPVPRPSHWGGYIVTPSHIEFWQEGRARFHDRIRFVLQGDGRWRGAWLAA